MIRPTASVRSEATILQVGFKGKDDTMTRVDCGSGGEEAALATAMRLMRLALPLLDRAGRDDAAVHLQRAIDILDVQCAATLTEEEMTRFLDGESIDLTR